ncbi:hypothetical protein KHP62_07120 [Rhodobacteraceae bacterium NNCM2]|nr:hypothetical protein [Coraliihabitans acroporae]
MVEWKEAPVFEIESADAPVADQDITTASLDADSGLSNAPDPIAGASVGQADAGGALGAFTETFGMSVGMFSFLCILLVIAFIALIYGLQYREPTEEELEEFRPKDTG